MGAAGVPTRQAQVLSLLHARSDAQTGLSLTQMVPRAMCRLLNKAVPAVTSAYISPCVLDMLPPDVDLVFLEFTFNDAERSSSLSMDDPTRWCPPHAATADVALLEAHAYT